MGRGEARRRAIWHGLNIAGPLVLIYVFLIRPPGLSGIAQDAISYWTVNLHNIYAGTYGTTGFFGYSPAAALLFSPLSLLSWPAFLVVWYSLMVTALVFVARRWAVAALAFFPVVIELYVANIHLLLAAVTVLGFAFPAAWSFALLTKVTPGVGLLWFVARREWRPLGIALGVTAVFAAVSVLLLPDAWSQWFAVLVGNAGIDPTGGPAIPLPLWFRLPIAAAVVWIGARRNARWVVPLGAWFALPVVWIDSASMLVAIIPLVQLPVPKHGTSKNLDCRGARIVLAPSETERAAVADVPAAEPQNPDCGIRAECRV